MSMNSTNKEHPSWRDHFLHRKPKYVRKGIGIENVSLQLNDHNIINVPGWFVTDMYVRRSGESYSIMGDTHALIRVPEPKMFLS